MGSTRSLEERIHEKDERMQKALEKATQYEAQKKQLERRQKEADRKARAHRLIEIGAAAEGVLGREFGKGDIERFMNFLRFQERSGSFYKKAMQKPVQSDKNPRTSAKTVIPIEAEPEGMNGPIGEPIMPGDENADAVQYPPEEQA